MEAKEDGDHIEIMLDRMVAHCLRAAVDERLSRIVLLHNDQPEEH